MNLYGYQKLAYRTLQCDMTDTDLKANCALGLAGEAGEVADHLKKVLYHGHPLDAGELVSELGDVLWYVAALCTLYDINLQDVALLNLEKLQMRYPNGFSREDSKARRDVRV